MSGHLEISLQLSTFDQKGLYLIFEDMRTMKLTEGTIENLARQYCADTSKIPPEIKKALFFSSVASALK